MDRLAIIILLIQAMVFAFLAGALVYFIIQRIKKRKQERFEKRDY